MCRSDVDEAWEEETDTGNEGVAVPCRSVRSTIPCPSLDGIPYPQRPRRNEQAVSDFSMLVRKTGEPAARMKGQTTVASMMGITTRENGYSSGCLHSRRYDSSRFYA